MGWLTGWSYRKSHIIEPASGAGQDYQIRIKVHFGSGTDDGEDVYLSEQCKTDFGDVRFTDNNGVTLLKYWIEKKIDSNYAVMWVKVNDDLGVYPVKIYIYYYADEIAEDNGSATFVFFDDFETDLSKWGIVNNASISTDHSYGGGKCVKIQVVGGVSGQVAKIIGLVNQAVYAYYYDVKSAEKEVHFLLVSDGGGHDEAIGVLSDIDQYEYGISNSGIDRTIGWHEFIIRSTNGLRQFVIDGNLMPITGSDVITIFILGSSNGGAQPATGPSYWDSVFVTKFVNPEPSHGNWGIVETGEFGHPVYELEETINTSFIDPLVSDNITLSLSEVKTLIAEDLIPVSMNASHIPLLLSEDVISVLMRIKVLMGEDLIELLSFSLHTPSFLSEEVISILLAQRTFGVVTEFPSGVLRKYPVIDGHPTIQGG